MDGTLVEDGGWHTPYLICVFVSKNEIQTIVINNFVIPYLFSLFRIKNITPGETMQVRGDMIKKKKTPIT